jgi:hypothetical protein
MATARERLEERMKRTVSNPAQVAWDEFEEERTDEDDRFLGDDSVSSIDRDSVPFGSDSPEPTETYSSSSSTFSQREAKRRREDVDAVYRPSKLSVRNKYFTTEYGDTLRVVPSGVRQDQRYLTVPLSTVPEHPVPLTVERGGKFKHGINPERPLTEDGYLNESERRLGFAAFRPEFVHEVIRRQQVIESHPDYAFLSNLAAELDLDVEDTFLETSISRALATAQAIQEQIRGRDVARRQRVSRVSDRLQNAEELLSQTVAGIRSKESPREGQLFAFIGQVKDLNKYRIALGRSDVFMVSILIGIIRTETPGSGNLLRAPTPITSRLGYDDETITIDQEIVGLPVNDGGLLGAIDDTFIRDRTTPLATKLRSYAQFSSVVHYLKNVSPSRSLRIGRKFIAFYDALRHDPDKTTVLKSTLFAYAALEFVVSMALTTRSGDGPIRILSGLTQKKDFVSGLVTLDDQDGNWIPFSVETKMRTILNTLVEGSTKVPPPLSGDADPVEFLFNAFIEEDILRAVSNEPERLSDFMRTLDFVFSMLNTIYDSNDDIRDTFGRVMSLTRDVFMDVERRLEGVIRSARTILQEDIKIRRASMAFGMDIQFGTVSSDYDYWTEILSMFDQARRNEIQEMEIRRATLEREVEELEEDLRIREIEGGPPETGGITSVPVASNPEWAFNPINTGVLKIKGWAINAINQGHAYIRLYLPRSWQNIDRDIFQQDSLMAPVFATLCATFVSRAKIGNPRVYMRDKMKKEIVNKRASILQTMLALRYTGTKFVRK